MGSGVEYTDDRYGDKLKKFDLYGDNGYAQDGYNRCVNTVMYKHLTEEKYLEYRVILDRYNSL